MRIICLMKWKHPIILTFCILLFSENLFSETPQFVQVSGTSAANGIYERQTPWGYFNHYYWKRLDGGYYIFSDKCAAFGNDNYWNINHILDDEGDVLSFTNYAYDNIGYPKNDEVFETLTSPDLMRKWDSANGTISISIYSVSVPTVTTASASSVSVNSATLGGNVTEGGGATVTERGVVYSTTDSTPTIDEGATKDTNGSGTGIFSETIGSLSAGQIYYYNAYATNSAGTSYGTASSFTTLTGGTWTGATSTDWATADNWAGSSVPTSSTDVTIPSGLSNYPVIGATTSADCKNLTVNSGASLTIQSSGSGTGSLIVSGTPSGTITCQRYMTVGKWHLVSPTASGQNVADFLTANTGIPTNGSNRGMMDYNTTSNSWNSYYTTGTGTMDAGKGYSARVSSDGNLVFSGTLTAGSKNVSVSRTGDNGWNCIGNPYPSAIGMNTSAASTENFITKNSSILDESYACVYIWDEESSYSGQNCYKIISNSGFTLSGKTRLDQDYIAPGQGFFVKAKTDATNISFTAAMQSHQTGTALKSAPKSWPGFRLTAQTEKALASTIIAFNKEMTTGLDVTFDAGLLRGTSGLEIYSQLVDDNGVDFAIQCLPENYHSLVIALGADCTTGGELTFSAETVGLSANCHVILEDKTAQIFTDLKNGATYKASVDEGAKGTGRFYIHTSYSTTGTALWPAKEKIKAYAESGAIWIEGEITSSGKAELFNMNGQVKGIYDLREGRRNSISTAGLAPGIYLLRIVEGKNRCNVKVVVH
ncbi:MAG: T9SS type A sorting domain-containing protein [Prolixibacteraceae bacterium]|jgi:hypothetical protein|nr:T9SS type A sorting domain-containing protein [Prolixibacteraceae bacterium]